MTTDSTPTASPISGTLHKRGYTQPTPSQDEFVSRSKADEGEAAASCKNIGQREHEGPR